LLFSVLENEKTAIAGGFSGILRRTSFCCCVNLPLLHRRWAGMAKPKIKGKEDGRAHGDFRSGRLTITTMPRHWQALYPVRVPSDAGVTSGDRLREADTHAALTRHG
jgi:hypothetical protein